MLPNVEGSFRSSQRFGSGAAATIQALVFCILTTMVPAVGPACASDEVRGFRVVHIFDRVRDPKIHPLVLWMRLEATGIVKLNSDGSVAGKLNYKIEPPAWTTPSTMYRTNGTGQYNVKGSLRADVLTIEPADLRETTFALTWPQNPKLDSIANMAHCARPQKNGACPAILLNIKAFLNKGVFEQDKVVLYLNTWSNPKDPPRGNYRVITKITPLKHLPDGDISVIPERTLVAGAPASGSGQRYYLNKLTLTVPKHPKLLVAQEKGKKIWVTVEAKGGGRLFADQPHSTAGKGKRELWFRDLQPGAQKVFYYAWVTDGPVSPVKETVHAYIQDPAETGLEGNAVFDVGIDLKVRNVRLLENRKPRLLTREPLNVQVAEQFGRGNVAEVLRKLDIAPVLRIKQTRYERPALLGYAVHWFGYDIFNVGEYFSAMTFEVGAADPKRRPARIDGADYAWPADATGTLEGSGERKHPYIFFHAAGKHTFEVDIAGLVFGYKDAPTPVGPSTPILQDPSSGAFRFEVEVTEMPETAGFLGVLFTCVGIAQNKLGFEGVAFEKLSKFKRLKFIWTVAACIRSAGLFVAGRGPLQESVELNFVAQTARQMTDAPLDGLSPAEQEALRRTPAGADARRAQEVQAIVKGLEDTRLVLISRTGLKHLDVESGAAGRLVAGPDKLDPRLLASQSAEGRPTGTDVYTPAKRIQTGEHFVIVPAKAGENLRIRLTGSGGAGAIFLVTAKGLRQLTYPGGNWDAAVKIGGEEMTHESGAKFLRTDLEPLDLGAPPEVSKPAPTRTDGRCTYRDVPGTCTIVSVAKTAASAGQAGIAGGPGYDGLDIRFAYKSDKRTHDPRVMQAMQRHHGLRLANSWYPGPLFVEKYRLTPGRNFACRLRLISEGSCTPVLFDIAGVNATDYFETARSVPARTCFTPSGQSRKSILDALRRSVARTFRQSVEFSVNRIRVCWRDQPSWAFVDAMPQRPGGGPIDWRRAGFEDCSKTVHGLLKPDRTGSRWTVLVREVCPTDLSWADWPRRYGAPEELFR